MKIQDEYYYYHTDHIGTPQKLITSNGEVVWSAKYNSFGGAEVEIETIENNLRFAGQYKDTETRLHYNMWRYYDVEIGRYLRKDPIGLVGGFNLFVYSHNNSIRFVDPFGLKKIDKFRRKKLVDCIYLFEFDFERCNSIVCNKTKKDYCIFKARIDFRICLRNIDKSMDLDGDGDVDDWDLMWWQIVRIIYTLGTPPGTVTPPGYGDDGPGTGFNSSNHTRSI